MFTMRSRALSRWKVAATIVATAAALLVVAQVSTARPAAADTAPLAGSGLPATVSADPLPTVQTDGVVWANITVGDTTFATGNFSYVRPPGMAGSATHAGQTQVGGLVAFNTATGLEVPLTTLQPPTLNSSGYALAASPDGSTIYATLPVGPVLYSVGHAHDCSMVGSFPDAANVPGQQGGEWHRPIAETTYATGGVDGADSRGGAWDNVEGLSTASVLDWFPAETPAETTVSAEDAIAPGTVSVSGAAETGWSLSGNSSYLVVGGELSSAGDPGSVSYLANQQGLVRYAIHSLAPNKVGPFYNSVAAPEATVSAAGAVTLTWPAAWDRDNQNLTYSIYRDGAATPIFSTTVASTFWQTPTITYTDACAAMGSTHTYVLKVSDPDGNWVKQSVSVVVPVAVPPPVGPPVATQIGTGFRSIGTAANADGTLSAFGERTDAATWTAKQAAANATFGSFTSLGGVGTDVTAATNKNGRISVFTVGTADVIYYRTQIAANGSAFGNRVQISGTVSRISAATDSRGLITVAAVNSSGQLYTTTQTAANGTSFGSLQQLAGRGSCTDVAIAERASGALAIVCAGAGGAVLLTQQSVAGGSWSKPTSIGGDVTKVALATDSHNLLHVYGVGSGGAIVAMAQTTVGGSFGAWTTFGGSGTDVAAHVQPNGAMAVLFINTQGALWEE